MFWQFEITSKILIESNRENIPVQYVSHALETTNSSRNKTILGSGDRDRFSIFKPRKSKLR
jgi:hypothetical protein